MMPMRPRRVGDSRPEAKIQSELEQYLRNLGWFVKQTHGDQFQDGFPDLFIAHRVYGQRWVEVKLPGMKGSRFTAAQLRDFPLFCCNGSGVWILTAATKEEYEKLFKPCNWWQYLHIMK